MWVWNVGSDVEEVRGAVKMAQLRHLCGGEEASKQENGPGRLRRARGWAPRGSGDGRACRNDRGTIEGDDAVVQKHYRNYW